MYKFMDLVSDVIMACVALVVVRCTFYIFTGI